MLTAEMAGEGPPLLPSSSEGPLSKPIVDRVSGRLNKRQARRRISARQRGTTPPAHRRAGGPDAGFKSLPGVSQPDPVGTAASGGKLGCQWIWVCQAPSCQIPMPPGGRAHSPSQPGAAGRQAALARNALTRGYETPRHPPRGQKGPQFRSEQQLAPWPLRCKAA